MITTHRTTRFARRGAILRAALLAIALAAAGCGRLSGEYDEVNGTGKLEFKGGRVYVTTLLGMTFVSDYEVDGDRVIIKGAGGSQVYTRSGDTLEGGVGMKFVKKQQSSGATSTKNQVTNAPES